MNMAARAFFGRSALVLSSILFFTSCQGYLTSSDPDPTESALRIEDASNSFWDDPHIALTDVELAEVKAGGCPTVIDLMENKPTKDVWDVKRMKPRKRFKIQSAERREGEHALAISLDKDDKTNKNGKHKHELWIANSKRCEFGEDIWYSFSLFITGNYGKKGSTRWVVGQWKEDTGGSPFLAQRFDNGVFHISIQRDTDREIIASSPGDYNAKFAFFSDEFQAVLDSAKNSQVESRTTLQLADDFGPGAFDAQALREAIIEQDIAKFPFVADPESYKKIEGVLVEPSDTPILPNPADRWVDMRYRVRGDRNGDGLIEVWADDQFIVRVTGKIGNDIFGGPTQYFKMGHYKDRDKEFDTSTIYFDRFRRSTDREEVD